MQSAAELQSAMIEAIERTILARKEAPLKRAAKILEEIPALLEKEFAREMTCAEIMKIEHQDHDDLALYRGWTPERADGARLRGAAKLVYDRLKETGFEVRINVRDKTLDLYWTEIPERLA